ncbi:unnamed protein product [Strongylus vulgaris]|uniref:Uncharacterized protein n=1 Tax=Strongylus vulgaris TaxID=40348 RepID=A0A3P7JJK3_STRVU|nr:unnamed protein product [Strongylus vulgaris]
MYPLFCIDQGSAISIKKLPCFFQYLQASTVLGQLPCRSSHFQYCQAMLSSGVGLNDTMSSLMFKDYTVLYNWFLYKWGITPGNTTNMLNVCNSLEFFNGCMSNDKGCFQVQNLMAQTDINNAFAIDGTLAMYQFNCGPGINRLACAQNIINGYQNYLQACVATYMSSITYDFSNGCKYVKNLMNCWSSPFGGGGSMATPDCRRGANADLWWACEANRVFTLGQFPNCGYSCDENKNIFPKLISGLTPTISMIFLLSNHAILWDLLKLTVPVQQQSALLADHLETHHKVGNVFFGSS